MAGFGLKIWTILQDLPQLQRHYPDSWETFLNNAGVIQAFGNTDSTTLKHLSDALGERVVVKRSASSQGLFEGVTSRSADLQTVPLLRPDEVRRCFARENNTQLVVAPGPPPVACARVNWDSDQEIKKLLSG
jgi:type IV secretion system protein VirD4